MKAETPKAKMSRMASSNSLGDDDPDSQDNDPTYVGPKEVIKAGSKVRRGERKRARRPKDGTRRGDTLSHLPSASRLARSLAIVVSTVSLTRPCSKTPHFFYHARLDTKLRVHFFNLFFFSLLFLTLPPPWKRNANKNKAKQSPACTVDLPYILPPSEHALFPRLVPPSTLRWRSLPTTTTS